MPLTEIVIYGGGVKSYVEFKVYKRYLGEKDKGYYLFSICPAWYIIYGSFLEILLTHNICKFKVYSMII